MQADPVVPSREPANGMANTISAPKAPPVHSQTGWRNAAAYPLHTPFSYAKRSYTLSAPREKEEGHGQSRRSVGACAGRRVVFASRGALQESARRNLQSRADLRKSSRRT